MTDHWCIACESFAPHSEVEYLNQIARDKGFTTAQIDELQRNAMHASKTTGHLYASVFRTLMATTEGEPND